METTSPAARRTAARSSARRAPVRAPANERLEARIPATLKRKLQQAADLSGARSLTEFVVSSAEAAAQRVLQEHDVIRLSRQGQIAFVTAILATSRPNAKLRRAAAAYRERMGL